jgi:methylenetetrahydrofolate reductase (NADPH)
VSGGPASARPRGPGALLARARFEVIPLRGVEEQVAHLPAGSVVTVTCSPRKGIEATLGAAERIGELGFRAVPHLSARLIRSRAHLAEIGAWIADTGIEDVFIIGGDAAEPTGPYNSALSMLQGLAVGTGQLPRVGVAGYPERHPRVDDDVLRAALLAKQRFAAYVVTQICFDATTIETWLRGVRRLGFHLPVFVGVPGALRRRKLLEISMRVGVGDSVRYLTRHAGIVTGLVRGGSYRPDGLVHDVARLAADPGLGIAGFHLNTFNQVESTERWRRRALTTVRWFGEAAPQERGHERGSAS